MMERTNVMEQINSLTIREVREHLIQYANELPLPMEIKRLIFAEVLEKINAASQTEIMELLQKREAEKPDNLEE